MNWEMIIPFILIFLIIFAVVFIYGKKHRETAEQYDERQELLRKNAYKYSAVTMILGAIIYYFITTIAEKAFMEDGVFGLLIALTGVGVFAIYSIFNDAFFGIPGKRAGAGSPAVYILILVIVIIGNGIGAVRMIREHELVRNGLLTSDVSNLALAILFLLILVSIGIKYVLNKNEMRRSE